MKSILLTSTALVAFAGAAVAEVTWKGDAEVGFNEEVEGGFYINGGLFVDASSELSNGMTAGIELDFDIAIDRNDDAGDDDGTWDSLDFDGSDYLIYVKSDTAGLYVGDTKTAAERLWSGTTNMQQDGFIEDGDADDGAANGDYVDAVVRGDIMMGGVDASLSYFVYENAEGNNTLGAMQLAVAADFGQYNFGMSYQDEDTDVMIDGGPVDGIIGVWAGTSFSGADLKLAYAKNTTTEEDSLGIQVSYPFGPVTGTVFYSKESLGDDNYGLALDYANGPVGVKAWFHGGQDEEIGVEGNYDLGNGLKLYAGYIQNDGDSDATETYIAGEYDMGGDATLLVSYGDAGSTYAGANDEIGDNYEVNEGATIAMKFKF